MFHTPAHKSSSAAQVRPEGGNITMPMFTLYIAPAFSDQAGQCRIYAREARADDVRDHFNQHPDQWREVGLMASDGRIRCIEPQFADLCNDQPLMAGVSYTL